MRIVGGLLALALLAGCTTAQTDNAKNDIAALSSAMSVAETLAAGYVALPPCPTQAPVCSSNEMVAAIGKYDGIAYAAVLAAQKTVNDVAAAPDAVTQAVAAAQNAVNAFQTIVQALPQKTVQQ